MFGYAFDKAHIAKGYVDRADVITYQLHCAINRDNRLTKAEYAARQSVYKDDNGFIDAFFLYLELKSRNIV